MRMTCKLNPCCGDPHNCQPPQQYNTYQEDTDMDKIFAEIAGEREYQDKRWGTKSDDTLNTPFHWTSYIAHYGSKWLFGGWAPLSRAQTDNFRTMMIKVAAIAVGAVESIDRQRAQNGRTFYEDRTK